MGKIKEIEYQECIASAPSSTANLGPGYDVFGLGLDALEDIVSLKVIKKLENNHNNIKIKIKGEGSNSIPIDPERNSAGKVAKKIIADYNLHKYECIINIEKNIPPGYGMGSSAASAVATAITFSKIFKLNINDTKLLNYAAEGELASAGIKHYDNIAGSFFGDFVIVRSTPELEFIKIKSPKDLTFVVCVPLIDVPKMKTEFARKILPEEVPLKKMVQNLSNACTIVAGFFNKDIQMICNGINDCIIEPVRKKLIPGYDQVKERSLQAGALAFAISGAGPSTIAFLNSKNNGLQVSEVMKETYEKLNIDCKTFICSSSKGAKIISLK
ncbi:MAG: homoserine kinase [Thermoproteota archaeon]|nr:homoserine kinase [Thermoproteota archaeon]